MSRTPKLLLPLFVLACFPVFAQPPLGDGSKIEVLMPGVKTSEMTQAVAGEVWWVLFQAAGEEVRLRYAPLIVAPRMLPDTSFVKDVHADGFENNEVIVLFRGTEELERGPVSTVFCGELVLAPGVSVALGPPAEGRLYLEAGKRRPDAEAAVVALRTEAGREQELVTYGLAPGGGLPVLRWAGDLDKDHRLDVLLETPASGVALYLSGHAVNHELVHLVASSGEGVGAR